MQTIWQSYGLYLWLLTALATLGSTGAIVILWRKLRRAIRAYEVLTRGVQSDSLDAILQERSAQIQQHEQTLVTVGERLSTLENEGLRYIGLVRFNPFGDVGGDQSFALALLDSNKNGLVLSTIFTRGNTRVYAKPIQAGRSTHHLSDEEIAAIERATGTEAITVQDLA